MNLIGIDSLKVKIGPFVEQRKQLPSHQQNYELSKFSEMSLDMCFNDARMSSYDKLEPTRDVFEMLNQLLQNGYILGSCMRADSSLHS